MIFTAKEYGSRQDFLFPGITQSSATTPSLSKFVLAALNGTPITSVRTLTGIGGLRSDKDWNCATDLVTFAKLKVAEDKRYYPGLGIFYLLAKYRPNNLPQELIDFAAKIRSTREIKFSGVSILCSSFLAPFDQISRMFGFATNNHLNLAEAFHSPSYEFSTLKKVVLGQIPYTQLRDLIKKLDRAWSFNSTIHLPWTTKLAGMSNQFMGEITNKFGDSCCRFGIGYKGKSLEIREYSFGLQRDFPYGVKGKSAYLMIYYPESDSFKGTTETSVLTPENSVWKLIEAKGFTRAALEYLKK